MNRKIIASLAALLVVGTGVFYAVSSGYVQLREPPQVQATASASAELEKETGAPRQQVDELTDALEEAEKASSNIPSAPPQASSVASPPVPVSESIPPIVVPMSQTPSSVPPTAPAKKENAGTGFEGYTVTVTDKSTLAVRAGGLDWPITKYYFISADGGFLGSISGKAMNAMIGKYQTAAGDAPNASGEWEYWFAEQFNKYRGLSGGEPNSSEKHPSHDYPSESTVNFYATSLAAEAFALINENRVESGLSEVEMDSAMMDRAEMRATELEGKYDHVRPDGTRMSVTYKCAEIINRRASTAQIAVSSWMYSSGHKDIILKEKYSYAGIGCYQGSDDTVYWCMLFSK